jgi:L-ribulose-5-phosphate 4-epimerase
VVIQNHGVFTIGPSDRAAVKAAVMTEDPARTVHLSHQLGAPVPTAASDVDFAVRPVRERLRTAI